VAWGRPRVGADAVPAVSNRAGPAARELDHGMVRSLRTFGGFPIVVNVATGLATLATELLDVLRSLGTRPLDILLKVGLARSIPYFFASLKIALTLAFVGSVISETIAAVAASVA
jgi:ABC-type nitrate/sulfonate/bicarbonate transport system permease component